MYDHDGLLTSHSISPNGDLAPNLQDRNRSESVEHGGDRSSSIRSLTEVLTLLEMGTLALAVRVVLHVVTVVIVARNLIQS